MTIKYLAGNTITGLSGDAKPTNQSEGSVFTETDTLIISDYTSGAWVARPVISAPMTSEGDMIYYTGGARTRLSVGGEGSTLKVNSSNLPYWFKETTGIFQGNTDATLDYITIDTLGNASDFGDLTLTRQTGGVSSGTRGIWNGAPDVSTVRTLDYITISTPANATDFGDGITGRAPTGGVYSETRGLWAGGDVAGSGNPRTNVIEYVTMATLGNTTDFGDLTITTTGMAGGGDTTRGIYAGGYHSSSAWNDNYSINEIQYVTIATTGNTTDFGDLTTVMWNGVASASSETRMVVAGGKGASGSTNQMEYITISTPSNATDFGDLTRAGWDYCGVDNDTRGCFAGGSSTLTGIDYSTLSTPANATSFGDLTTARYISGSHGVDG